MNPFEEKWLHAAAVLNGHAQPKVLEPAQAIPSLAEWSVSNEGLAALSLLAAADREIIVVSMKDHYLFGSNRVIFTQHGLSGYSDATAESNSGDQKRLDEAMLTTSEATQLALAYNEDIESSQDLVTFLRNELNEIARDVNEKALASQAA